MKPEDYLLLPEGEKLTEEEHDCYSSLLSLAEEIIDGHGPDLFELPKELEEEGYDPESAYMGFVIGTQFYAQTLFEEIVETLHSNVEGRVLN